jgi:Ca2+-binding RTX toxin-like protein
LGEDNLHGGRGHDQFRFNSIDDSPDGVGHDVIDDFHHGDKIHLSHIDADPASPGNQKFQWIGEDNFHNQAGELRFVRQGADVLLQGDVDGDGAADFEVLVQNLNALHRHDIIL